MVGVKDWMVAIPWLMTTASMLSWSLTIPSAHSFTAPREKASQGRNSWEGEEFGGLLSLSSEISASALPGLSRPTAMMLKPAPARRWAHAFPMPFVAPTTTALRGVMLFRDWAEVKFLVLSAWDTIVRTQSNHKAIISEMNNHAIASSSSLFVVLFSRISFYDGFWITDKHFFSVTNGRFLIEGVESHQVIKSSINQPHPTAFCFIISWTNTVLLIHTATTFNRWKLQPFQPSWGCYF